MAFEIPLEADRVDDLSFISTFIRSPLMGTLMWILGGAKANEAEEQDRRRNMSESLLAECDNASQRQSTESTENCSFKGSLKRSILKKATPSLVGSLVSDADDSVLSCSLIQSSCSHSTGQGLVRSKNLSWSDESGQELAHYIDEGNYQSQKPEATPELLARPRSSMTRTGSVQHQLSGNSGVKESRYLPNRLRTRNEFTKSVTAHNANVESSGADSPQWGWYIRTTPPTPEMYYSSSSGHRRPNLSNGSSVASSSTDSQPTAVQPNPVFQDLQGKTKATTVGWSGVPL